MSVYNHKWDSMSPSHCSFCTYALSLQIKIKYDKFGNEKDWGGGKKMFIIACSKFEHKNQSEKKECLSIMAWEQEIVTIICFYTVIKKIQCLEQHRKDKTLSCISKINSHQYLSSQCSNLFLKYQELSDKTRLLFCS